ncbi:efflux RND transporter permease subunit [Massilia cavernae]|uniref:Acriflavine resistance protein B n=1 Tax=Massilia cavernae TaxID=2320864 RepID=A0A418Y4I7_9BURK|nr:efflux RND transporter permease subunit [Massilia cavernae]RJG20735.1 acriflavine resistance protein B [Massilia cavernae]
MNIPEFCMRRPIATMLLWLSASVAGIASWKQLPISALPDYDTPTLQVTGRLTGASPETMSVSVATPLEKEFSSIPGLTGTTSTSVQGETKITLEFEASRNIDAAAGDVQAALFRVSRSLPAEMTSPPSYKKLNPGDAPVLLIGLSSPTLQLSELNGFSDNLIVPSLSAVPGVAQVTVTGQKRYAVRIGIDPQRLAAADLTIDEVAAALKGANANTPVGQLDGKRQMLMLQMAGGLRKASDFGAQVIATRNGHTLRLRDVATVEDSIENAQNSSNIDGASAILLTVQRQPGANTVATIDAIRALLPRLQEKMPASVRVRLLSDRSLSIRDAMHDVHITIMLTIALVIMVILLFLRSVAATVIAAISLPLSLLGTFGLMSLLGLSLNNISLMGITIAVGLVVDDAIVVLENIIRYIEQGLRPVEAALRGAREVSFTVVSISVSLVAVFIPIFFMPGTIGLLFHEFAIVVSLAILVSACVALTLIPLLAPLLIGKHSGHGGGKRFEAAFAWVQRCYLARLDWALRHRGVVLSVALATFGLTAALYIAAPKGFFPQEDIGQIQATVEGPQDMSFLGRLDAVTRIEASLLDDPAIESIATKVDHDTNGLTITLKPRGERPPMSEVLTRLRKDTAFLPGIQVLFSPVQNLKIGGRSSKSTYQYTLQAVGGGDLDEWASRLMAAMRESEVFVGVNSDSQKNGLQVLIDVDRDKAAQLGVELAGIRSSLYAAFGRRQVSTIYAPEDSYKVIMEVAEARRSDESDLAAIHVRANSGTLVPLSALARVRRQPGTMAVNHQGQLAAVTISFDLRPGKSLSDAGTAIEAARAAVKMPQSVFGAFAGLAAVFDKAQSTQLWLILVAVATIYVVLGMLYESWIHPVTILLGVPSAALGALLALRLCGLELTFIAMIGILLLVGVVKKNAIMMIDFALDAQRRHGATPEQAIRSACELRFRPIMMTTLCALLGALPIALGIGAGAELRQPLGVTVVGGLLVSQVITLFITPVLYLWFEAVNRRTSVTLLPAGSGTA